MRIAAPLEPQQECSHWRQPHIESMGRADVFLIDSKQD
jgi:hypothetical protein